MTDCISLKLRVPGCKVSVAVDSACMPRDLPPLGTPGTGGKATVGFQIEPERADHEGDFRLFVRYNLKKYREILRRADDCPNGSITVIQGYLKEGGNTIGDVRMLCQPRQPVTETMEEAEMPALE